MTCAEAVRLQRQAAPTGQVIARATLLQAQVADERVSPNQFEYRWDTLMSQIKHNECGNPAPRLPA